MLRADDSQERECSARPRETRVESQPNYKPAHVGKPYRLFAELPLLTPDKLASLFAPDGALASHIENFRARPQLV